MVRLELTVGLVRSAGPEAAVAAIRGLHPRRRMGVDRWWPRGWPPVELRVVWRDGELAWQIEAAGTELALADGTLASLYPGLEATKTQLDAFRLAYNEQRPHRAVGRATPGEAYRATPKALPSDSWGRGHFRLRYDVTDGKGAMTMRRGGRLHHLKVGAAHARRRVLAIVDEQEVTVVDLATGEILSTHLIEPGKGYWRNQQRDPGRWPGSQETG
jgi:hypothetical protein